MTISKRWKALDRQVEVLRKQFLPSQFNPQATYPRISLVREHARAFLLLSHAELETYLEDWAKDLTHASQETWNKTGKVTQHFAFLIATCEGHVEIPEKLNTGVADTTQVIQKLGRKVFQAHFKRVKDNHGIRESNLLALFFPLGISLTQVDTMLMPNLHSLGGIRGQYAHRSRSANVAPIDPEVEYKRVRAAVDQLKAFDEWLVAARRRIG